jgi:hypothetical protein
MPAWHKIILTIHVRTSDFLAFYLCLYTTYMVGAVLESLEYGHLTLKNMHILPSNTILGSLV